MSDQNPTDQPPSDAPPPGPAADPAPSTSPDPAPPSDSTPGRTADAAPAPPADATAAAAPTADGKAPAGFAPADAAPTDFAPGYSAPAATAPADAAPPAAAPAGYPPAPGDPAAPAYPLVPAYPAQPGYPEAAGYPPAPGYPVAAGYPAAPAYPTAPPYPGYPQGYTVPAYANPGGVADPLVTLPAEGFSGWFSRLFKVIGANWQSMYLIGLVTVAPVLLLGLFLGLLGPKTVETYDDAGGRQVTFDFPHAGAFIALALALVVLGGLAGALGQAAFVWTMTRKAVGRPAPLSEALGYGLRNAFRVWGWTLLYGLLTAVGICACVLPGLYVLVAGSLYLPVALYLRGSSPLGTSFSMVNKNFGAALGRMSLLLVMLLGAEFVVRLPGAIVAAAAPALVGQLVSLAFSLLAIPLSFVIVVGSVLLFAELRARQHPLTSTDLDAVL